MPLQEAFNAADYYSLALTIKSTSSYYFANNGAKHTFTVVVDDIKGGTYTVDIKKVENNSLGDSALIKIYFFPNRIISKILLKTDMGTIYENRENNYNISSSTESVSIMTDYDNGSTVKNGIMWRDTTDPNNIVAMNIGDKFLKDHKYEQIIWIRLTDGYKYKVSSNSLYINYDWSDRLQGNVQGLDLDSEGYATKLKIIRGFSLIKPKTCHDWVVTSITPATMNSVGSKSVECSICGACTTQEIPRIRSISATCEETAYTKKYVRRMIFYISKDTKYSELLKSGKDFDVVFKDSNKYNIKSDSGNILYKGLPLGTYDYQIIFKGDYSGVVNRKVTIKLGTPNVGGVCGVNTIKVTWTKVEGATFYRVFEKNVKTGKVKCIAKKATGNSYLVKQRASGTKYVYIIRAYRVTKSGQAFCGDCRSQTYHTRCAPPVVKSKVSGTKITIYWKAVRGAESYTLYKYDRGKEVYVKFKGNTKDKKITFNAVKGTYLFKVSANSPKNIGLKETANFSKPVKVTVK